MTAETADEAANRIIVQYMPLMIEGNARGDMAWTARLQADIAAAIRAAVAPMDPDGDGRVGGSRKRRAKE